MSVPPTDHVKAVRSGWIRNRSACLAVSCWVNVDSSKSCWRRWLCTLTQASSCAQCNAIEPNVLYQIMKRALEPRLSTLMGPLAAVLWKPSGQGKQTSQAQSPVVLHQGMLRHQRQTCTKRMQTTGTQAQGHSTAIWPPSPCLWAKSLRRFLCAFLPGHVNTRPPCQTNTCAIYPNPCFAERQGFQQHWCTQIAAKSPGAGWANIPSDRLWSFSRFPLTSLPSSEERKKTQQGSFRLCQQPLDPPADTCYHDLAKSQPPLEWWRSKGQTEPVRVIGPKLLAITCSQKLRATLKVYLGEQSA